MNESKPVLYKLIAIKDGKETAVMFSENINFLHNFGKRFCSRDGLSYKIVKEQKQ
jgi:hypothetical protein